MTGVNGFDPNMPCCFVAPDFRQGDPGSGIEVLDPATLTRVGSRLNTNRATLERIVADANAAQAHWGALDTKTRAAALHRIADRIEQTDPKPLSTLLTREMGKPYPESVGELANCGGVFRYFAEMARDDGGKIAGTTQPGSFQFARYHPYGVSIHILPFNFPLLILCWTVAASLAAGNACIVKPAEATTLATLGFMPHFAGLPAGLVCCVPGDAEVAQNLIASPDTHVVAFTGSVAAGRAVGMACADRMKPCVIEAGGSDPMIISAHAPLEVAAKGAVTAAFHLSGQICTSAERLFVVDEIHDRFVSAFATETARLRIGNGLGRSEIGPLVSEQARTKVQGLVEQALAAGATRVCGGGVPPGLDTGWFFEPTILTDVSADMDIMNQECFGPVAAICRVRDFDHAIRLANESPYGLGASVFTTDLAEAMNASERLEAGMVWVNNPLIDNDALPFGGWKMSGVGRELSRQGLDAFRRSKMVVIDHEPKVQDWWYPYPDDWFLNQGGRSL